MSSKNIYSDICSKLKLHEDYEISDVEPIALPHGKVAVICNSSKTIRISSRLTIDEKREILIHEVAHLVMWSSGYCSVGHGYPFLATYQILLYLYGYRLNKIGDCAETNWNSSFIFRNIKTKHVEMAECCVNTFDTAPVPIASEAKPIGEWIIQHFEWPTGRVKGHIKGYWHTLISETRGMLFLFLWITVITLVWSLTAIANKPSPIMGKIYLVLLGLSILMIIILGRYIDKNRLKTYSHSP